MGESDEGRHHPLKANTADTLAMIAVDPMPVVFLQPVEKPWQAVSYGIIVAGCMRDGSDEND